MEAIEDTSSPPVKRKLWRRFWVGLVVLLIATPLMLWVVVDLAGRRAWKRVQAELRANGEATTFAELDLPTWPNDSMDENFCAIPWLMPEPGEADEPVIPISEAFARAFKERETEDEIDEGVWTPIAMFDASKIYDYLPEEASRIWGNPAIGLPMDLDVWEKYLDEASGLYGIKAPAPTEADSDSLTRVLQYVDTASGTWQEIDAAAHRPRSFLLPPIRERYTRDQLPAKISLSSGNGLSRLQRLANLLRVRTTAAARSGDMATVRTCLQIYRRLIEAAAGERTMLGMLIAVTTWENMKTPLIEATWSSDWVHDADTILYCQEILEGFDFLQQHLDMIGSELVYSFEMAEWIRDHRDEPWNLGLDPEAEETARKWARLLPRGWFDNSLAYVGETANRTVLAEVRRSRNGETVNFSDLRAASDVIDLQISSMGTIERINHAQSVDILATYGRILFRSQMGEAWRRMALINCALHRWALDHDGSFPTSLNEMVPEYLNAVPTDPFDASPMRYQPSNSKNPDKHFLLYSIGLDLSDDGGELLVDEDEPVRTRPLNKRYIGDWPWPTEPRDFVRPDLEE